MAKVRDRLPSSLDAAHEAEPRMRGASFVERVPQDLRYALRGLRRNPGFALLCIGIMALGIGANTAVFSVVDAVLLNPLPYPEPDRIVTLSNVTNKTITINALARQVAVPDFHDWRDQSTVFDSMAYYATRRSSVVAGPGAEYARVTRATPEFFRVLGVQPAVGRVFAPEEANLGGRAAIVSSGYAAQHLGGASQAVGQTVRMFGRPVTVVGVMPPSFDFPYETDIWFPATAVADPGATVRTANNYLAIGRLKQGVVLQAARAEMAAIAKRLEQAYPQSNKEKGIAVTPLVEATVGDARVMLYLLLGAVGLVLLIACANVATLLLAKATARSQEMATRTALGASRARIVQQLVVEGLVQAFIAGAIGVAVAFWGTKALVAIAPGAVPRLAEAGVDVRVLAFTLLVCTGVGLLFALPSALQILRSGTSESPLAGRTVMGGAARRLRDGLVMVEIALTVTLLAGGGLLVRSLLALQHVSLGFSPEHVVVMETTVPRQTANAFFAGLLPDIAMLPGVVAAGATMSPPGRVDSDGSYFIDHLPTDMNMASAPHAVLSIIAPGAFAALGIPLRRGRDFDDRDTSDAPRTAIINDALARQAFGSAEPLGRAIFCPYDISDPMTIVGVVGDVRQYGPARQASPECYFPYLQHAPLGTMSIVARTTGAPDPLAQAMRLKARGRSADASVRLTTMDALLGEHFTAPRFRAILVTLFAAVALGLALAGVYGVMAYTVAQRSREIGLRMALGATPGDVLRLILKRGTQMVGIGLIAGLLGAAAATRLLTTMLFATKPSDVVTYISVVALLSITAALAIYVPARRATKVDPYLALRQE